MEEEQVELIVKYLQGHLSDIELDNFLLWINADSENKKLFFEIKAMYEACDSDQTFDVMQSWKRLLQKRQKQRIKRGMMIGFRWFSYAATLVLVVTASVFFWNKTGQGSDEVTRYIGGNGVCANVMELPDGTKVHVGPQTTFYYKGNYGEKTREVYLEGEAYFDVAKQKDKPFIVKVKGQDIEVLGTKFNVLAYPNDSLFVTTLLEGSVSLFIEKLNTHTILNPDEQFVYNRQNSRTEILKVKASEYLRWTEGYYYFREQSLKSILDRLSRVYELNFVMKSDALKQKKFTGTFYKGQNIEEVLDIINVSVPFKYKIEGRNIVIYN